MKHNKPFRSVFDGDRYCGALIYSPRGWQVHNAIGKVVCEFDDDQAAVAHLRSRASVTRPSMITTTSTGPLRRYHGYLDGMS
jgi:hypothetical protein